MAELEDRILLSSTAQSQDADATEGQGEGVGGEDEEAAAPAAKPPVRYDAVRAILSVVSTAAPALGCGLVHVNVFENHSAHKLEYSRNHPAFGDAMHNPCGAEFGGQWRWHPTYRSPPFRTANLGRYQQVWRVQAKVVQLHAQARNI